MRDRSARPAGTGLYKACFATVARFLLSSFIDFGNNNDASSSLRSKDGISGWLEQPLSKSSANFQIHIPY
jgi:hypothetical protein